MKFGLTRSDLEDSKTHPHDLLAKHSDLFEDSYDGGMKGLEAHITMKSLHLLNHL